MIKKTLAAAFATLIFSTLAAVAAPSPALDLRGVIHTVDMVMAISGGLAAGPIIRVTSTSPNGKRTEEYLPVDAGAAREGSARIYFDPGMDQLIVGWVNRDGSLAISSRQAPGLWLSPVVLETGSERVTSFHAGIDRLSRLQVVWEIAGTKPGTPVLRHRTYDAITLDPISGITSPFFIPGGGLSTYQPSASSGPDGGTDDPGGLTGGSGVAPVDNPLPTNSPEPPDGRAPAVMSGNQESYGVVAGCSVPVAYRTVNGQQVEIASRTGSEEGGEDDPGVGVGRGPTPTGDATQTMSTSGPWARGVITLGADRGSRTARELASEIATRFCWP